MPPSECHEAARYDVVLTNILVNVVVGPVLDVDVIDEPAAAAAALDPLRARLLAALAEPGSASTLAGQVGLTRQKVNYHLRTLEEHGLVREVGRRAKRGLT